MMDRTRTYGRLADVVDAYPQAWYRQDGHYFDRDGNQVDEVVKEIAPSETGTDIAPPAEGENYEQMHWKTLKVMVEDLGGDWTNKVDAIEFLRRLERDTA